MYSLARAYLFRLRSTIKSALIQVVAFSLGVTLLVVVIGLFCPWLYTSVTRYALIELSKTILGIRGSIPNEALSAIAAAIYTPFLSALTAAVVASNVVSSAFLRDKTSGVFEVLLSAPVTRRSIVAMLIIAAAIIALVTALTALASSSLIAILSLYLLGYLTTLSTYYIYLSLLLVPTVSILSALIGLIVTIIVPLATRVRTGLMPWQNLASTISLVPALVPFAVLHVNPTTSPLTLALYTAIGAVILSIVTTLAAQRVIKPENLIA